MNEASQTATCSRCGTALAPNALKGLCPRCLMALNLVAATEIPGETGPQGTKVVKPLPALEEIAQHFPQFEILECLGRGGMGVVYKARQPKLNRIVALKILAPERVAEPKFAERFEREAQALARLNHPNIVTVYDFGEVDGLYYLTMEFVDGLSLRRLLQTRKIEPKEALAIVPKICEALQFAHDEGVVHRDIKPENLLLDKKGRVKIADFGIAKIMGDAPLTPSPSDGERVPERAAGEGTLTEGQVLGTPNYMAPEQVEHPQKVDHRADIYSLGVVFYEMLTGDLPLGKFQPPSKKVQVDVRLDEVVLHALEREPELRYQQASQVKTAVETIAQTSVPPPTPTSADQSQVEAARRQVKGPAIGLFIVGGLNLGLVISILAYNLFRTGHEGKSGFALLALVPAVLLLAGYGATIVGASRMRRMTSYGLAITAAICAMILPVGFFLGLPIGIWSLSVLSQREVREAFGKSHPLPRSETLRPTNLWWGRWWGLLAIGVVITLIIRTYLLQPFSVATDEDGVAVASNDILAKMLSVYWSVPNEELHLATGASTHSAHARSYRPETEPVLNGSGTNRGLAGRDSKSNAPTTVAPTMFTNVDLGGGITMEFVLVRPGSFTMGATIGSPEEYKGEKPAHTVKIAKPFYLGKYEVTQEQWDSVMEDNPSRFKGAKLPVENVSWEKAQSFVRKLHEKTGRSFALPTEAQWEYACRAGTITRYCFGDDDANLGDYAWFAGNSEGITHPIGQKKPNRWGLYDMHGNVWEWCGEGYGPYPGNKTTGMPGPGSVTFAWEGYGPYPGNKTTPLQGPPAGNLHAVRGGGWTTPPNGLRSSDRNSDWVSYQHVGLRCVMLVDGLAAATTRRKPENPQPGSSYAIWPKVKNLGASSEAASSEAFRSKISQNQIKPKQASGYQTHSESTRRPDGVAPSPAGTLIFSPVIERVVYDISTGSNCFLNFETRELLAPTRKFIDAEDMRVWVEQHGADLGADDSRSPVGERALTFLGGCATGAESWYRATAESVVKAAQEAEAKVTEIPDRLPITVITAATNSTTSFIFKTLRGQMGILQITGFTDTPRGVEIRYKLVRTGTPNQSSMGNSPGLQTSPELAEDTQMRADIEKDIPLAEALRQANQQFSDTQPLTEDEVVAAVRNIKQVHPDIPEDFYKTYQRVVNEHVLPRGMYFSHIPGWDTDRGHFKVDWKDLTLITLPVGSKGPCFNYRIRARFIASEAP